MIQRWLGQILSGWANDDRVAIRPQQGGGCGRGMCPLAQVCGTKCTNRSKSASRVLQE